VSATEFAFLAFGLVLGVAAGIALAMVIRSRPSSRQVRLTIAPGSVAVRRPQTLSSVEPEDHSAAAIGTPEADRTAVRPGPDPRPDAPAPASAGPDAAPAPAPASSNPLAAMPATLAATRGKGPFTLPDSAVGIPIEPGPGLAEQFVVARKLADPESEAVASRTGTMPSAARVATTGAAATTGVAMAATRSDEARLTPPGPPGESTESDGSSEEPRASATEPPPASDGPPPSAVDDAAAGAGTPLVASTPGAAPAASGPCAEARQVADERCSVAQRSRVAAQEAMDRLLALRREYDEHRRKLEAAEAAADPRSVRDAKEAAQRAFRSTRGATVDTETAARDWLHEINRINGAARDAQKVIEKERQATRELLTRLDRVELEADAARIGAETTEDACREAREAVARCEEAVQLTTQPPASSWAPGGPADLSSPVGAGAADTALTVGADASPVILRLVRGDRAALERTAATLGGADPVERRNWQHRLSNLTEAIVARAIEASFLDFPEDHRFWGPFTRAQCRDIVASLSSLGFRFDGLGGWAEERVPSQRDLSLAVGYAGLDPMRIRHWPKDAELADLFRTAFVAADEWLAGASGELTLGEMIDALGRRADDLTEVWNEWGKVRPALLATD